MNSIPPRNGFRRIFHRLLRFCLGGALLASADSPAPAAAATAPISTAVSFSERATRIKTAFEKNTPYAQQADGDVQPMQWGNWPNWGNWGNWNNWQNWQNWNNWRNW